jgi:hypothetical protein
MRVAAPLSRWHAFGRVLERWHTNTRALTLSDPVERLTAPAPVRGPKKLLAGAEAGPDIWADLAVRKWAACGQPRRSGGTSDKPSQLSRTTRSGSLLGRSGA